ncbi:alanine dehydrogenase [Limnospira maxima CS-328]|uniref:Alanine dehydrogenase n=1 Tax=Limnospira maxima CS-328 TaxID=513049 RepID=B5W9U2_LIMMA|nr:alanine dehydrogenase [Limnospira maxima CS-328]
MQIGVPKEVKDQEFRVGLSPSSVRVCCEKAISFVETEAGWGRDF